MTEYSQNGYSVVGSLSDCRQYTLKGSGTVLPLRKDDCGYVLAHFAGAFDREVEELDKTDCHGYNKRKISGSDDWSNHAAAVAVDLNATRHDYGKRSTFTRQELENLRDLLDHYDDVIKWGGDYRTTVDEMHFEIDKGYLEVQRIARRLRRSNVVHLHRLKPGRRNVDVLMVKRELKRRNFFDGAMNEYFGTLLTKSYGEWQRHIGYEGRDANGVPGEESLKKLGFTVKT